MSDWFDKLQAQQAQAFESLRAGKCGCHNCIKARGEVALHMVVCRQCGNKRCPHATNHDLCCTGSNEPGQAGSVYE
jgi:hypothetical protein